MTGIVNWIDSKLVWNASEWKRWWSMRFIILTTIFGSISAAYLTLPPDWMPAIGDGWKQFFALGTIGTSVAAGLSRVIQQKDNSPGGA